MEQGFDIDVIKKVVEWTNVPVIALGGAGKYEHFIEGVLKAKAQAVSTANLFNFIEDGLTETKQAMHNGGISMAFWKDDIEGQRKVPV